MKESRAYHKLKEIFPHAHWQRIETPISPGIFDVNVCWNGVESWVECKQTTKPKTDRGRLHFEIKPAQIAWEWKRRSVGGRTFVAIMADSDFFLLRGYHLKELKQSVHVSFLHEHALEHKELFL